MTSSITLYVTLSVFFVYLLTPTRLPHLLLSSSHFFVTYFKLLLMYLLCGSVSGILSSLHFAIRYCKLHQKITPWARYHICTMMLMGGVLLHLRRRC